ncbi:hypothetical protein Pan216_21400 [Planctomycetes bacterium Pan216]|uniref:Uncharacterized protein n=1 Tax=Kolteria novifilia TaxID=2527975 RepID=A0A518B2T2_9BACT|nr:hypothetical protein Pan216_21400 [Planctomycetes bacterium Pan216]
MAQMPEFKELPPVPPLPDLSPISNFDGKALDGLKGIIEKMYPDMPPAMQQQLDWCGAQLDHIQSKLPETMKGVVEEITESHGRLVAATEQINNMPEEIEKARKKKIDLMKAARAKMGIRRNAGQVDDWHGRVREEVLDHYLGEPKSPEGAERSHDEFQDWVMTSKVRDLYESVLASQGPSSKPKAPNQGSNWQDFLAASDTPVGAQAPKPSGPPSDRGTGSYMSWVDWLGVQSKSDGSGGD